MKKFRFLTAIVLSLSILFCFFIPSVSALEPDENGRGSSGGYYVQENPLLEASEVSSAVFYADRYGAIEDELYGYSGTTYYTHEGVRDAVRNALVNREASVVLKYKCSSTENFNCNNKEDLNSILSFVGRFFDEATEHTGNPKEGDYIAYHYQSYAYSYSYEYEQSSGKIYFITFKYTFSYYTSKAQEDAVDAAAKEFVSKYIKDDMSDYEKIKTVYDYICSNVDYDYEHLNDMGYTLQFTAYAALINKTSVCQGYASLFYRLALACGIDNRVVTGVSNSGAHAWNIVKLGSKYYYIDSTWDSEVSGDYYWFLKGATDFSKDHSLDNEFKTEEFSLNYPISESNYFIHDHEDKNSDCKCDLCGESIAHQYVITVLQPTCVEVGYTNHTCSVCGDTYADSAVPATGHKYVDTVTQPTCTEEGYTSHTCSVCGDTYNDSVSAARHSFDKGYCSSCGEVDTSWLSAGWHAIDGKWYLYGDNNNKLTGWQMVSGKWYYMNPADGIMQTGWLAVGGSWYYMNSSGAMVTGWAQIGGSWYYMNSSGAMVTGWAQIGGKWYYMNSSGAMVTGWAQVGGKWYYMNSSGAMVTGWAQIGGKWYYMNSSGVMQTGWVQISGKWYYMNSSGVMVTGTQKISGKTYKFNSSGVWVA